MKTLFVLSITAFISQVFGVRPQQQWGSPEGVGGTGQPGPYGPPGQSITDPPSVVHWEPPPYPEGGIRQRPISDPPSLLTWGPAPYPDWSRPPPPQPVDRPGYPGWGPPESGSEWGSPESGPEWGLPGSGPEWEQPGSGPQSEWYPRPENQCKCIPKNVKTNEISPIVSTDVTYDSVYPCDSTSRVKQISYQAIVEASKQTCNGVIVTTTDDWYDLVYANPPHAEYSGKQKERVTITNYTTISTFTNGNSDYIECGTIATGRCAGDNIWGTAIAQANDQKGCCNNANTGNTVIFRIIEIKGKCESRCSLGRSTHTYAAAIGDWQRKNELTEESRSKSDNSNKSE